MKRFGRHRKKVRGTKGPGFSSCSRLPDKEVPLGNNNNERPNASRLFITSDCKSFSIFTFYSFNNIIAFIASLRIYNLFLEAFIESFFKFLIIRIFQLQIIAVNKMERKSIRTVRS